MIECTSSTYKIHDIVKNAKKIVVSNRLGVEIEAEFDPNWRWVAADGSITIRGAGEIFRKVKRLPPLNWSMESL